MTTTKNTPIITEIKENISTRQQKYGKNFDTDLSISQELPHEIATYLRTRGIIARPEDDHIPFIGENVKQIRLCDIMAIDFNSSTTIFLEAKDYCRLVFYEATGLPQRYINDKLMKMNQGKNLFLIFRENFELINTRAKKWKKPTNYVLNNLVNNP